MIGYTTVGTNDLEAATAFYDELLVAAGMADFAAPIAGTLTETSSPYFARLIVD